jgi:uncharacterized repeat protein (TIGR02543 family)
MVEHTCHQITKAPGTTVIKPQDPTKQGYIFNGWYKDSILTIPYTFTTMPSVNITLYAKWYLINKTITFNSNGGTYVPSITNLPGTTVIKPQDPIKQGYIFDGWYSDINLTLNYTFTTMPSSSITLYAKWNSTIEITSFTPYPNVVDVYCTSIDYTYCEGNAITETAYTTHKTKVYLDPDKYDGGVIRTEVTWDIMPDYRLEDYISSSWDGNIVKSESSTIKGSQKIYFDYKKVGCFGFCITEEGSTIQTKHYTRDDVSIFQEEYHGVIMIVNLQDDYDYSDIINFNTYEILKENDNYEDWYHDVTVNKIVIDLETHFNLDGLYNTYRDTGILKFGADYRHSYVTVQVSLNTTIRAFLPKPSGGLVIDITPTIAYDDSRLNTIDIYFR